MDIIEGRVAVITGGGSGIGRGLALSLGRAGASVVLADINPGRAKAAAGFVHAQTGARTLGVATDVSDPASVDALAEAAYAEFGHVHILANNAGVATVGLSWQAPLSEWDYALGVNLMGPVYGVRSFVPRMLADGQPGHILNTSSMAGLLPVPLQASYTASKHAVVGFSEALQGELRLVGAPIGVSVVCPGGVATSIITDARTRDEARGALTPAAATLLDQLRDTTEGGITGEQAGDIIADAIRQDRFWVFPNGQEYFPLVKQIQAAMFAGT